MSEEQGGLGRRLVILAAMVGLIAAGAVGWKVFVDYSDPGPFHQGISLRKWRQRLKSTSGPTQQAAVSAMGHFGPDAAPAVPDLIRLLDADPATRNLTVQTLGYIGPAALPAVPRLVEFLDDPSDVSEHAAKTLERIGPTAAPEAAAPLIQTLATPNAKLRNNAYLALGAMGPAAFPEIRKGLKSENPQIRGSLASLAWLLKVDGIPLLEDVRPLTDDPDEGVRKAAALAVRRLDELKAERAGQ